MNEFFKSLEKGVLKDSLSKENDELILSLTKLKAVVLKKEIFKLQKNFLFGIIDISSKGLGFLSQLNHSESKDLLIETQDLNTALNGDLVLAKKVFSGNTRAKAKVIKVFKRRRTSGIVYTKLINGKITGVNIQNGLTHTLLASQKYLKNLKQESVLIIDFESGAIIEILGLLSDPLIDEKIVLALYSKKEEFKNSTEVEASSYGDFVDKSMYMNRTDLTTLDFCTIDPIDAKDFDDAIYFDKENLIIYIAIADVSEYVTPFGSMDAEAKERGFTIYFPHKSIPMLPRKLSENICSLKPNENRLSFCFKIELDSHLNIKNETLIDVIISSKKRYTYDTIDDFLENKFENKDEVDDRILSWLLPLNKIINKIRNKRLENAFEFDTEEISLELDSNTNLISTKSQTQTPAHSLIEDCMLLANKAAAKKIREGIFRNHGEPDFEKIDKLLLNLQDFGLSFKLIPDLPRLIKNIQLQADDLNLRQDIDKLIIKSQRKAVYEHINKGHFGLGFKEYTHFTSPIRRYSDLILHRLLKAQIRNNKKQEIYQLQNIESICKNISDLERESEKIEWSYMDRKFARWAKENINKEFEAIIVEAGKNIIAKLDGTIKGARIFLTNNDANLLERVKIKITASDIASSRIIGRIVSRLGL